MSGPLEGIRVVSLAVNLPGPAAVARLVAQGASATTVLPPGGDPLEQVAPAYFAQLHAGQTIEPLDLKGTEGRERLEVLLSAADVLVTSSRPAALARLGLDPASVSGRHTRLCQVEIVGHAGARAEVAGHDLTYQAAAGLLGDGRLPTTLAVDLVGGERAAAEATAALVERSRTGKGTHRTVVLADVATTLAAPVTHGLTAPGGLLGGGLPTYHLYAAADGQVALAALEPHFAQRLAEALGVDPADLTRPRLADLFTTRTARAWQEWAQERDLPLVSVASRPTGPP